MSKDFITRRQLIAKIGKPIINSSDQYATREVCEQAGADPSKLTTYGIDQYPIDDDVVKKKLNYSNLFRVDKTSPSYSVALSPPLDVTGDFDMELQLSYVGWAGQFTPLRLSNRLGNLEFWVGCNEGNISFNDANNNQHILGSVMTTGFAYLTMRKRGSKIEIDYKPGSSGTQTNYVFDYPTSREECTYIIVSDDYQLLPGGWYVDVTIIQI